VGGQRKHILYDTIKKGVKMMKKFNVVIERDEDGYYVASVPELPGCHTQAKTLDELRRRIEEAIKLYLEVEKEVADVTTEFIGVQVVEVPMNETHANCP
jgi:predicted RNase H-like HicB family nuclease